jgi:hypothetical protein
MTTTEPETWEQLELFVISEDDDETGDDDDDNE